MAIGRQSGVGKATYSSGPKVGRPRKTGNIGTTKKRAGSALTLDQNRTKIAYPTTTTT